MTGAQIRPAAPADAAAVVALRALVYPYLVRGEAATRRLIADPVPGEGGAAFVAEVAGAVVGWVAVGRNPRAADFGAGDLSLLHVHPGHRGRGAGSDLLAAARAHLRSLGVITARATVTPGSRAFARRRGFTPTGEVHYAALPLRPRPEPPLLPPLPPGLRLRSAAEVGPEAMYRAEAEGAADEPGPVPAQAPTYAAWRHDVWDDPGLDRRAGAALVTGDGTVVAFSAIVRDGDRVWSDMTATLPGWRGRGLARLAKTAALSRARERGARIAYTANAGQNAAMLAINERLGYRRCATQLIGTVAL